tara:strand:+ start:2039 stop:2248 length:210 start_codon:yes stop_codon:yes gene_type:complete
MSKTKIKKPRCCQKGCSKKLKLTDLKCGKCNKRYCGLHRCVADHTCIEIKKDISNNKLETAHFKKLEKL